MDAYRLLVAGLVADVIVLLIGVIAAYLRIPYAVQIIVAALGALALLIRAISSELDTKKRRSRTGLPSPTRRQP